MIITIPQFTNALNGGANIIGYEIQIDDGDQGDFITI